MLGSAPLTLSAAVVALFLFAGPPGQGKSSNLSPGYSLEISLPQDVIRADQEVPLEVTLRNTSDQPISYGMAFGPPVWSYAVRLVVRDSEGNVLQEKRIVRGFRALPGGGPPLTLAPGEKRTLEILLNRVYDLSKPGRYTIQAESSLYQQSVKSNTITASFPGPKPLAHPEQPPFSVRLSTPYGTIKSGYQISMNIEVTNISPNPITLRTWQEHTGLGAGVGHEFSSGIFVYDERGNPLPKTKAAQALDDGTDFPSGRFTFTSLPSEQMFEETRIVGQLYDMRQPGTYKVQVVLFDPKTNLNVKSNVVTVNVVAQGSAIQAVTQPPFVLDIRLTRIWSDRWKDSIVLAITNRSDHTIDFDIGAGDNDIDVYDSHGDLAPLTENGRRCRGRLRTAAAGGSPVQRLQPGETKSGGLLPLRDYYDLSRSGRYTIRVRAFDDESKTIVASNQLTLDVSK